MLIKTDFCNKYGIYTKKANELSEISHKFAEGIITKFGKRVPIAKIGAIMLAALYDNYTVKLPFYYHKAIFKDTVKFCQQYIGSYHDKYIDRWIVCSSFHFESAMSIALEA